MLACENHLGVTIDATLYEKWRRRVSEVRLRKSDIQTKRYRGDRETKKRGTNTHTCTHSHTDTHTQPQ